MESDGNRPGPDDQRPGGEPEPTVVRLQRRRDQVADLSVYETVRGGPPSSRTYRRTRPSEEKLRRVGEDTLEATKRALRPESRLGRAWAATRAVLIGQPLATSQLKHERLSKVKALAIFSSDALSSAAYATEEILLILILAGTGAMTRSIPISLAIAALAVIVVISYRQTIRAYPNGGGAYIVASENLGALPGLIAGSALVVDYIMTVAVSTAAGVAAVTSAVPSLHGDKVPLALLFVLIITLGNLRGIRESGTIFAIPTYFFIFTFGAMLVAGLVRIYLLGQDLSAGTPPNPVEPGTHALTLFLLLRAFSSGAAALTGIEAVANGVPSFKPPEAKNAMTTQSWMAAILCAFFVGVTVLAHQLGVIPSESKTVVAQIGETVFGKGVFFYALQVATALILVLAANTAFAGLPTLTSVMARDSVMPKQFLFRGDRLAFSNGIILLGLASSAVLFAFSAETHRIIPLYAFGVFTAFTLSQLGMIVHWTRTREPGWRRALAVNAVGATATGVVALIVGITKFALGAWLSMAIMAGLVVVLWRIKVHYRLAAQQLGQGLSDGGAVHEYYNTAAKRVPLIVLVPVEGIDNAVLRTVSYARSISPNTTAIHVTDNLAQAEELRRAWAESVPDVPLKVVESPYRSLVEPIIAYLDGLERTQPNAMITVVLPEFITHRPWQQFLHNQLAARLKKALLDRRNTVIVDVPYHLKQ
jgi:amino acid transporter